MTAIKFSWRPLGVVFGFALGLVGLLAGVPADAAEHLRNGDYIVAIVNQELVTAGEVEERVQRAEADAARAGAKLPPEAELRKQVLDGLIEERVLVTYARDSGLQVDDPEIDRAVQSVATQNQLTLPQLRERLRLEGLDYKRFRANLRDQILVERTREREVNSRIQISDQEVDDLINKERAANPAEVQLNLAQILVAVPEGADAATVAARKARAEAALARVKAGEDFASVAREISEDGNRAKGGEIGLRPASRLPDVFVAAVKGLGDGEIASTLLRSNAGFHVLKVVQRTQPGAFTVTQTRARHILLRTSPQLSVETAARRLADYRSQIESGKRTFEDVARAYSEDGSAAQGGELGWAAPGTMVPEFEEAMNKLSPGEISPPVVSRFGVHLIQVLERRQVEVDMKQVRAQARNVLRERKFAAAYADWVKDLRSRAYVEMREPPQ